MKVKSIIVDQMFSNPEFVEMFIKFSDSEQYHSLTLTIDGYIGDTPDELADSLQKWVDAIRETGR